MNAVILSAGRGGRLLPLTEKRPKCLLPLQGRTLIEWQIDHLLAAGVERITVVVGFEAGLVEKHLGARYGRNQVRTLFNPFYQVADNLGSCWIAREAMSQDFVLLNGDTVFELALLQRVLDAPRRAIALAVDYKPHYDGDDMRVSLDGTRLLRVGKDLPADSSDAESIGLLRFCDQGPELFRAAVENRLHEPDATESWYLAVIDRLARRHEVSTVSVQGLQWAEVDYPRDYEHAQQLAAGWRAHAAAAAAR